jgi:hypothetical protein
MLKLPDRYLEPDETRVFWGELAPREHIVQIYRDDAEFLNSLELFVATGLRENEAVVVIATPEHRAGLELRLSTTGYDPVSEREAGRYLPLDARETLEKFMVNGWPDESQFERMVREVVGQARHAASRVRAFGEMVALMWEHGDREATIRLEHLWHRMCSTEAFALFCAYPQAGFTKQAKASLDEICAAHSRAYA